MALINSSPLIFRKCECGPLTKKKMKKKEENFSIEARPNKSTLINTLFEIIIHYVIFPLCSFPFHRKGASIRVRQWAINKSWKKATRQQWGKKGKNVSTEAYEMKLSFISIGVPLSLPPSLPSLKWNVNSWRNNFFFLKKWNEIFISYHHHESFEINLTFRSTSFFCVSFPHFH